MLDAVQEEAHCAWVKVESAICSGVHVNVSCCSRWLKLSPLFLLSFTCSVVQNMSSCTWVKVESVAFPLAELSSKMFAPCRSGQAHVQTTLKRTQNCRCTLKFDAVLDQSLRSLGSTFVGL